MSTGNLYQQLPGNPFLRKALDPQTAPPARLVWATLTQAYETRTLLLQQQESAATRAMHHRQGFSTPATTHLHELRQELKTRTTTQDNDND